MSEAPKRVWFFPENPDEPSTGEFQFNPSIFAGKIPYVPESAIREAVEAERERCARIAEARYCSAVDRANFGPADVYDCRMSAADEAQSIAAAIRTPDTEQEGGE